MKIIRNKKKDKSNADVIKVLTSRFVLRHLTGTPSERLAWLMVQNQELEVKLKFVREVTNE